MEYKHDPAAEAATVGSMIVSFGQTVPEILDIVSEEDFIDENIRTMFSACVSVYRKNNGSIDGLLVRDEMQISTKEGLDQLQKVVNSVVSAANGAYYAQIVKRKSFERQLITSVDELSRTVSDQIMSVEEKQAIFEQAALQLRYDKKYQAEEIKDVIVRIFKKIDAGVFDCVLTGYPDLDRKIGGFKAGEVIIIAGRPSMGKSSFMLNLAVNVAESGNSPVVFSLEMTADGLVDRLWCGAAGISKRLLYNPKWQSPKETEKMNSAYQKLCSFNFCIDSSPSLSPAQLTAKVMRYKATKKIDVVFVDYLQLMNYNKRTENRQQEVTKIMSEIKACAVRCNIPIIVLSQLSRAVEGREDHRPRLSDLRDSGSIEQDADIVLFLHREQYYNKDAGNTAVCIVAKNRQGETGDVMLEWFPEQFAFKAATNQNSNQEPTEVKIDPDIAMLTGKSE